MIDALIDIGEQAQRVIDAWEHKPEDTGPLLGLIHAGMVDIYIVGFERGERMARETSQRVTTGAITMPRAKHDPVVPVRRAR